MIIPPNKKYRDYTKEEKAEAEWGYRQNVKAKQRADEVTLIQRYKETILDQDTVSQYL